MTSSPKLVAEDGGLGLEYLSVFGMPLLEYVALAAQLGCDFVSLNLAGPANRLPPYRAEDLRGDASLRRDVVTACADAGIGIGLVEGFAVSSQNSAEACITDLDKAADLGASSICVVSIDKDLARTYRQFAVLAEAAAARGLVMTTEVGAGVVRDFRAARLALEAVAHPNFKLLLDTMHFFRSGGTVEDLSVISPDAIGHVQLCDVPMPAQIASYMDEALFERRAPGDGDLPLRSFLTRIPPSVPVGLEVPIRSQAEAGVKVNAPLAVCVAKGRALLSERRQTLAARS